VNDPQDDAHGGILDFQVVDSAMMPLFSYRYMSYQQNLTI